MGYLVRDDSGQLIVAGGLLDQTLMDEDVTAGQGKGVHLFVIDDGEGIDELLAIAHGGDAGADVPDSLLKSFVCREVHLALDPPGQFSPGLYFAISRGERVLLSFRREIEIASNAAGRAEEDERKEGHAVWPGHAGYSALLICPISCMTAWNACMVNTTSATV